MKNSGKDKSLLVPTGCIATVAVSHVAVVTPLAFFKNSVTAGQAWSLIVTKSLVGTVVCWIQVPVAKGVIGVDQTVTIIIDSILTTAGDRR
jgi:hypothetical protein